ncbi:MAG: hypothetical protein JW753_01990 [Dehalococcoidia bacterium]|nr:hypothetical protein [Dehalococcoidia bacterium]
MLAVPGFVAAPDFAGAGVLPSIKAQNEASQERSEGFCVPVMGCLEDGGPADGLGALLLLLPLLCGKDPHIEEIALQTNLLYGGQNHWQNLMIHATMANMKMTMVANKNRTSRTARTVLESPIIGKTTKINMKDRTPRMDKGMKLRQLPSHLPKFMK